MNKYECYIPQEVYDEVITEMQWFYERFKQDAVDFTIEDKVVIFFNSISCFLELDNDLLQEKFESIYKCFVGPNSNLDIIPQETIIKAIGELLSHYWHIGSSVIDKFIFQLIIKKGHLSKEDCIFLVERAFDGNAWPFVAPLWHCSDLPQHRVEQFFHWRVADYPLLRTALSALLTKVKESCVFGESIFIYSDDKLRIRESECFRTNEKKLLSFIYRRRKIVVRSMKKSVYSDHITYRLIKGLMYMY
jgi:hypothetical protein